jgi:hypothetical protein
MASTLHVRPSELLGVSGTEPRALFLDRAVMYFGRTVEADQEAAEKRLPKKASEGMRQSVRQRVLDQYLGIDSATVPGRFRDPATSGHRRRRVNRG